MVVVVAGPVDNVIELAERLVVGPDIDMVLVVGAISSAYQAPPKTTAATTIAPIAWLCRMWNLKLAIRIKTRVSMNLLTYPRGRTRRFHALLDL